MQEIVAAFVAESDVLARLLQALPDEQWAAATPAEGWDVRDSVTHLAVGNELAEECARTGRSAIMEAVMAEGSADTYEHEHLAKGRSSSPAEVLTWWRATVDGLAEALRGLPEHRRLPWGPTTMSAVSFTTARLMETWAHGLDCFDAVDQEPEDTKRLRHVAHLGLRALPYAFAVRGQAPPGAARLELTAPDSCLWCFGEEDAPNVITGTAGDWCRAAVHRDRRGERARLSGTGPDAAAVITNVQAYLSA